MRSKISADKAPGAQASAAARGTAVHADQGRLPAMRQWIAASPQMRQLASMRAMTGGRGALQLKKRDAEEVNGVLRLSHVQQATEIAAATSDANPDASLKDDVQAAATAMGYSKARADMLVNQDYYTPADFKAQTTDGDHAVTSFDDPDESLMLGDLHKTYFHTTLGGSGKIVVNMAFKNPQLNQYQASQMLDYHRERLGVEPDAIHSIEQNHVVSVGGKAWFNEHKPKLGPLSRDHFASFMQTENGKMSRHMASTWNMRIVSAELTGSASSWNVVMHLLPADQDFGEDVVHDDRPRDQAAKVDQSGHAQGKTLCCVLL